MRAVGVGAGLEHPQVAAALEDRDLAFAAGRAVGFAEFLLKRRQDVVVQSALHDQHRRQLDRLAALEDQLRVAFLDVAEGIEIHMVAIRHVLAPLGERVVVARQGIADRRARRHVADARVDLRVSFQRQRVVARVLRPHAEQHGHVAAAGAAEQAQCGRIAVPAGRLHLQPANAVARVLHRGRVRRFAAQAKVDGHREQPAARHGLGHRRIGHAILERPGPAVQVQQYRKRPVADRLVNSGEQLARGDLPEVLFPDLYLVVRIRIVSGCHRVRSSLPLPTGKRLYPLKTGSDYHQLTGREPDTSRITIAVRYCLTSGTRAQSISCISLAV